MLPSRSRADDAAFHALRDASLAIAGLEEACIVGGQMVALLSGAFPSRSSILRRTVDADAAVSPVVAASGALHALLTAGGYTSTSGNHYIQGDREIDVLVPATGGGFEKAEYGGRGFDGAPGLHLALSETLALDVTAVLLVDGPLTFATRVPGVERALIVKALAYESRRAQKDLVDLYALLLIREAHDPDSLGGWRIGYDAGSGARRDAALALHRLVGAPGLRLMLRGSDVPEGRFAALVRTYVADD
ncbi:hypothetical protein IOC53_16660 [Rathayibacter sp. SD072]|nr:hypothetical protein [Rathayibacter sp. SD072]